MPGKLRWGIIGTGAIAGDFAKAVRDSKRCEVVGVAGSSAEKSKAFAKRLGLPIAAASIEAMLAEGSIGAVYIATPHPMHEQHALACIDRDKAVLCEKPITMNAESAERVIAAARDKGVFLMEAYMYRCHPILAEVVEKLKQGVIGPIRHVRADFGFYVQRQPEHRLFNPELGGGGILDVGGYPASFARLIAGLVADQPFDEPIDITATGHVGPTGVDELAFAQLQFRSGLSAQLTCAIHQEIGTGAWVYGEAGVLHLPDPWTPQSDRHGRTSRYSITLHGQLATWFEVSTELATYGIEAERVASSLPSTQATWPAMGWEDTLGNMRLLDAWREQVGVTVTSSV